MPKSTKKTVEIAAGADAVASHPAGAAKSAAAPAKAAKPKAAKSAATPAKAAKPKAAKTAATPAKAAKPKAAKSVATPAKAAKPKAAKSVATPDKAAKPKAGKSGAAAADGSKPKGAKAKAGKAVKRAPAEHDAGEGASEKRARGGGGDDAAGVAAAMPLGAGPGIQWADKSRRVFTRVLREGEEEDGTTQGVPLAGDLSMRDWNVLVARDIDAVVREAQGAPQLHYEPFQVYTTARPKSAPAGDGGGDGDGGANPKLVRNAHEKALSTAVLKAIMANSEASSLRLRGDGLARARDVAVGMIRNLVHAARESFVARGGRGCMGAADVVAAMRAWPALTRLGDMNAVARHLRELTRFVSEAKLPRGGGDAGMTVRGSARVRCVSPTADPDHVAAAKRKLGLAVKAIMKADAHEAAGTAKLADAALDALVELVLSALSGLAKSCMMIASTRKAARLDSATVDVAARMLLSR